MLLRALIFRLRALFFFVLGTIFFTVGLPFSALYWLFTGTFLPFHYWVIGEELLDSI